MVDGVIVNHQLSVVVSRTTMKLVVDSLVTVRNSKATTSQRSKSNGERLAPATLTSPKFSATTSMER